MRGNRAALAVFMCKHAERLMELARDLVGGRAIEVDGEPGAYSDHAGVLAEIELGGPGARPTPPTADALTLARELLDAGRARTGSRRRNERIAAGASFAAGVGAAWASTRPTLSRRAFLRAGLWGTAALAATSGAGLLTLSEGYVPDELTGYVRRQTLGSTPRRAGSSSR